MSFAEAAGAAETSRPAISSPDSAKPRLRLRRVRPREDVHASVGDGACVSAMVGLGETYFAAFALALGTGQTLAGLVATAPMLAGASLQLATPWFLQRLRSYRNWVVLFASLQATALVLMPLATLLAGSVATCWIFLAASIYWAASQATGPAWNTWIEGIVPRRIRARFFARRARVSQISTLAGFVFGGLILQAGNTSGQLLTAFVSVFLLGASARYLSAWFLSCQSEPSRGRYQPRHVPMRNMFDSAGRDGGARLVIFLLAMQVAVQISGPYFAPYMLAQQKLSYLSYMLLIGLGFFGKVIALPLWGRLAQVGGPRRLLWIGGTCIVPVAGLWLGADLFPESQASFVGFAALELPLHLSSKMAYLCTVQIISGSAWAGYELAMQLMFIEAIPRPNRPYMLTYYNFGNAAAQVAGGLIGATILQLGAETHLAYMALFGISSLMRLCTLPLLQYIQERPTEIVPTGSASSAVNDRRRAA